MSDFPNTTGKVILNTNFGEIIIELFCKECPLACKNFIQLCLEGYYNNKVFNRILKDFLIQIGDNSESTYGSYFKDEFHSRLKFKTKGLVGCVNNNRPNSNNNQFFITLIPCQWLDNVNTIFGKIVGNSIYNIINITSVPVDTEGSCVLDNESIPKVINVDVVINPFIDILLRKISTPNLNIKKQNSTKDHENLLKLRNKLNNKNLLSLNEDDNDLNNYVFKKIEKSNFNESNIRNNCNDANSKETGEFISNNDVNKITNIKEVSINIDNIKDKDSKKFKSRKFYYGPENNDSKVIITGIEINANINDNINNNHCSNVNKNEGVALNEHLCLNENENLKVKALEKYKQKFMKSKDVDTKLSLKLNKNINSSRCYKTLDELKSKFIKEKPDTYNDKNKNLDDLKEKDQNKWLNHKLKFHVDSEKAYFLDKVNKQENDKFDYYI